MSETKQYVEASIAVLMPAYNEELTIESVIKDFTAHLPTARLYVVNNGSLDRTVEFALRALKEHPGGGAVLHQPLKGKGNALRFAFQTVEADFYITVDADLTYPAADVLKLLMPVIEDRADMVVGDRLSKGAYGSENKRRFHGFGNWLVVSLINTLFGSNLRDIMSGYRAMNRRFVKNFPIFSSGFQIETEMTLHCLDKRFRVHEVATDYRDRPVGSFSKLNTFRDGMRVLKVIFAIFAEYKPFMFFGLLSLVLFFAGLLVGIPVVTEFIEFRYVYKVPSAILATGLVLVSVLSFNIGIICEAIQKKARFAYELSMLQVAKNQSSTAVEKGKLQ